MTGCNTLNDGGNEVHNGSLSIADNVRSSPIFSIYSSYSHLGIVYITLYLKRMKNPPQTLLQVLLLFTFGPSEMPKYVP